MNSFNFQFVLKDYLNQFRGKELDDASLGVLMLPFGLSESFKGAGVCVGLVLEDLRDRFKLCDVIDPIDIAESAAYFNCNGTGAFLDRIPKIMTDNYFSS